MYKEGHCFIGKIEIKFLITDCGCWQCINKAKDKDGYSRIYYKGVDTRVHRASYQYWNDIQLSRDIFVLHICDNPCCTNPDHLMEGTAADNARHKINHGRQPYGEESGNSKLTEKDVLEILTSVEKTPTELAEHFNVTPNTIRCILRGKTWNDIYERIKGKDVHKSKMKRMSNKPAIHGTGKLKRKNKTYKNEPSL